MNLGLSLSQRVVQEPRLQLDLLAVSGGATRTIFPLVEKWLQETTDHWNALRVISKRKVDSGFHSVVDFILVSVCPAYRQGCFAYYAEEGPPLREIATERERRYLERRLLAFLEVAYAAFVSKRRLSWEAAVAVVDFLEVA